MAGKEYAATDIHANIVRLRREVEWYSLRLQETRDRLAALEQAAAAQSSDVSDRSASDDGKRH